MEAGQESDLREREGKKGGERMRDKNRGELRHVLREIQRGVGAFQSKI